MAKQSNLVCSIGMKDLEVQTFRTGGPGGQKQNKTSSGVRLIHHPSGARAESRSHRSQLQNKREALRRLAATKELSLWVRQQAGISLIDAAELEKRVDKSMKSVKIEVIDENGKWVTEGGKS